MFDKKFDFRVRFAAAVILVTLVIGGGILLAALWPTRDRTGYEPKQPIEFSHRLHTQELQIDCMYCHTGAEKNEQAGVPPISTCMNCHGEEEGKVGPFTLDSAGEKQLTRPEIQKIIDSWKNETPIEWNRVYELADFAYFNHSRHIVAGLDCKDCHGDVQAMDRIKQVTPLTMGWCLDCHKGNIPESLQSKFEHGKPVAPISCSTCHR